MSNFTDSFQPYKISIFSDGMRLPEIDVKPQDKVNLGLDSNTSNFDYMKKLAWIGCLDKIKSGKIKQSKEECIARFKEEFPVLEVTGVTDYFLFLRDILIWCDSNDIPRGPSRGSVGGCFTAYCIDIIYINPLDYDLTFSRFLSEARAKPVYKDGIMYVDGKAFCDIDCDVGQKDRSRVLDEVARRYEGKTAKILTLQELTGKMAMKDTVKSYLEYGESEALEIGSYFEAIFGKMDSVEKTQEKSKQFAEWIAKEEVNKEAFAIAKKIEGLYRGAGVHASGTLCCYYPLTDVIPLQMSEKGVVSGYSMDTCLTLSIKIDLLGILTLDILKRCEQLTGVKYRDINVDDPSIYDFFQRSTLFYGLFQISNGITKDVVTKIKPKNIGQVNAALCIGRPGSIKEIPKFLKWLETGEKQQVHPEFDEILKETANLIIFQEDINRICQKVYKMSAVDADSIRAAIGKKKREEILKWEPVIKKKGLEQGVSEDVTKWFWDTCNASADYLFSHNHSRAYSFITCYTTYYKANFPKEYYLACLQHAQHEQDPIGAITQIQGEMKQIGLELLSPDILLSKEDYSIEEKGIRCGLSGIKGLSEAALLKLSSFKSTVSNKFDLLLSLETSKIPVNVCQSLFYSGAFDSIKGDISRNRLLLEYEVFKELTNKEKVFIVNVGAKYNYDLLAIIKLCAEELKDEKGKFIIKESRRETLRRDTKLSIERFKRNNIHEELSYYLCELEYLGYSPTSSLKKIYSKTIKNLSTIKEAKDAPQNVSKFIIACIIKETERKISREKKKPYLSFLFNDDTGEIKSMIFGEEAVYEAIKNNEGDFKEGDLVIAHLSRKDKSSDMYFCNMLVKQPNPVTIKKSQIAKELEKQD